MITLPHKAFLVAALALSVALGAGAAYAFAHPTSDAPPAPDDAGTHAMPPSEHCRHMPETCAPSGGSETVGS